MSEFTFLGTGPANGLIGKGKSGRHESSAVISTSQKSILIDCSRDFPKDKNKLEKIDAVFITHGHLDAMGGIKELNLWKETYGKGKLPLFTLSATIEITKKTFGPLKFIEFISVDPYKSIKIGEIKVIPIPVIHSLTPGFPTLGFYFEIEKTKSLAYLSDVGSWSEKTEFFMKKADILILDGSMWHKKIKAHLTIDTVLPKICQWPNGQIIFTHIGRTAPTYENLTKEVGKICPKAKVAYDGMKFNL